MYNQVVFYKLLYRTINFITLPLALYAATFTRFLGPTSSVLDSRIEFLLLYGFIAWISATSLMRYYEQSWHSRSSKTLYRTSMVAIVFYSFVGVFSFIFKEAAFSRIIITLFAVYQWLFALITHNIIRSYITHQNSLIHRKRSILLVGEEDSATRILSEVENHDNWGTVIIGYISDTKGSNRKIPYLGDLGKVRLLITDWSVQELIVTLPLDTHATEIEKIVRIAEDEGIRVQIIPRNLNEVDIPLKIAYFGSLLTYRVRHVPLDDLFHRFLKRTFDLVLATFGVIVLAPLLIPVIVAIKLADGGPILFVQKRTGRKQDDFNCYKFRSMTTKDLGIDPTTQPDGYDPRLLTLKIGFLPQFPLGVFLRKSNIDELPQLFNVIRGDMSLVGPRPHMTEHTEQFRERVDSYMLRHFVRPGITGLAQVNGYRGKTDTKEKLEGRVHYDLKYVENWTIALDIQILFETVFSNKAKEKDL